MAYMCGSIADVVGAVSDIISCDNDSGAEYYFRGECMNYGTGSEPDANIGTTLYRKDPKAEHERELYEEALRYNITSFQQDTRMCERLARLRHYQVPTRFADLSENALVSTFFATAPDKGHPEAEDLDGWVHVVKINKKRIRSFDSDIIAAISHLPLLDAEDIDPTTPCGLDHLAWEVKKERSGFYEESEDAETGERLRRDFGFVWPFRPILNSQRLYNQSGIFLAFGCGYHKEPLITTFSLQDYNNEKAPSCGMAEVGLIRIRASAKNDIVRRLRHFGVWAERIYPDLEPVGAAIAQRVLTGN